MLPKEILEMGMDKLLVTGGKRLEGEVYASGAKNSVLKLMAAAILAKGKSRLRGVPRIRDVFTMMEVLNRLGVVTDWEQEGTLTITPSEAISCEASYDLIRQMRASIIVLGPLLARLGEARVAMPGGCNIGSRKIDLHLRGFEQLGAQIEMGHGYIRAKADILTGARIFLEFPSVGATENLMMAAVLARGNTIIDNAATEPEIVDLADFLNAIGARIEGAGSKSIIIEGTAELRGADYQVIPDRIEAGTLMIAAAITGGDVWVKNAFPGHLGLVIGKLRQAGVNIEEKGSGIRVISKSRPRPVDIATLPYPGFPTDLQAQMMALLSLADGISVITENVFENRFVFIDEINKMGARIEVKGQHAIINGVDKLRGASVQCPDLRAGAGLVLAGLAAEGATEINQVYHIDRGYEDFEHKLQRLGADIRRVSQKDRKRGTTQPEERTQPMNI
jgi:UDP-N-acetylglucosamine 1-carboxyvinyltransferase